MFKILKIDFIIIFSSSLDFITLCLDGIREIPVIILAEYEVRAKLEKFKRSHEIHFIQLDQKTLLLDEKLDDLLNAPAPAPSAKNVYKFISKREKEILKLIALGKKNREIAVELFLSIKTVENHRTNILKKTNARNMLVLINELNTIGFLKF